MTGNPWLAQLGRLVAEAQRAMPLDRRRVLAERRPASAEAQPAARVTRESRSAAARPK
jgi:hypothetical protein